MFEQACLEAESKWKKKHDSNYSQDLPVTGDENIEGAEDLPQGKILPMLAQKYKERKHHLVWPIFVQPKFDGVRCLVARVGDTITYMSRKAKPYKNFGYMDKDFLSIMKDGEILDGEMYNHGEISFQEVCSLVKNASKPDIESLKRYVKFYNYDRPDTTKGFKDRYYNYQAEAGWPEMEYINLVMTTRVQTEKEFLDLHDKHMELGYEGTMARSGGDEGYVFQYRDNQLQKYKDFIDAEFTIIGAKDGKGSSEGQCCFRVQGNVKTGGQYGDGSFDAMPKGTRKLRAEYWENWKSYVGKPLTVRYQRLSDEGIPTIGVGIAVRDYE
jgi:ATP-dependent DNA ligase